MVLLINQDVSIITRSMLVCWVSSIGASDVSLHMFRAQYGKTFGSHVHIAAFCHLLASEGIELKDFSGISQGVKIYSKTDDYSGNSLTNQTIPNAYKSIKKGKVIINEHSIIGAGCVILPNVTIGEGTSVGALSLIGSNLDSWTIYVGNPLKKLTKRSKHLLEKKQDFLTDLEKNKN